MNHEPGLIYVYAATAPAPGLGDSLADLRGVGGAPVTLLAPRTGSPGPAFVVSEVPSGQWGEEGLRARFEDLAWLEDTARAHHEVIQALTEHTVVLPLRLATLYQDNNRALEALSEQRDIFSARLALLAHHVEYGVKVYVATEADTTEAVGAEGRSHGTASTDSASPGKAYLRARRAQHHAREDRYQQARRAADRIAATAAVHATHGVRHPVQTGPLTRGEAGENVVNDAFLVPDEKTEDFRAALEQAGQGLPDVRIEVTGPWAPYSFAMPSAQAADTADRPGP
ncbi:GvpL/GvpF family gas vesicle protein [Streptomyces sp. NPDC015661]|uniref:GvpL/GvpF family gas vesicle protein n=1 Tax=Streptomyces sp. NPDC015661 TaxID=3364961 RepID=UPI0036FBBC08